MDAESFKQRNFPLLDSKARAAAVAASRAEAKRAIDTALHISLPVQAQTVKFARDALFKLPLPNTAAESARAREIRENWNTRGPDRKGEIMAVSNAVSILKSRRHLLVIRSVDL